MVFNGTCNGVNMQNQPAKIRYHGVTYTSCWGGNGAKSIFDTIDRLNPGDEIDYITWQKLIYANKLLAKKYNIFHWEDLLDNGIFPEWNGEKDDWDYKRIRCVGTAAEWEYVKIDIDEEKDICHVTPVDPPNKEPRL